MNRNEARLDRICSFALNRKPINIMDIPKVYRKAKENAHYNNDILLAIVTEYVNSITVKV